MYHQTRSEKDELRARFTKWLETTVYRARIDYIRKSEKGCETISLEELSENLLEVGRENDPFDKVGADKNAFDFEEERLAEAFRELPLVRQHILTMLFFEELKSDEIAQILHCTTQHVYNQRSLALKKLRAVLRKGRDGK